MLLHPTVWWLFNKHNHIRNTLHWGKKLRFALKTWEWIQHRIFTLLTDVSSSVFRVRSKTEAKNSWIEMNIYIYIVCCPWKQRPCVYCLGWNSLLPRRTNVATAQAADTHSMSGGGNESRTAAPTLAGERRCYVHHVCVYKLQRQTKWG